MFHSCREPKMRVEFHFSDNLDQNMKSPVLWYKASQIVWWMKTWGGQGEFVASKERCDAPSCSPPQGKEPDVDEATKDKIKEVHHY